MQTFRRNKHFTYTLLPQLLLTSPRPPATSSAKRPDWSELQCPDWPTAFDRLPKSFQTAFNVHSGLALGSFCIITGIVLLIDAVHLVATNIKKEK